MGCACRHHRGCRGEEAVSPRKRNIVLAGNPNVGKSVFFSYFTKLYTEVSNYPGTTVEVARGRWNGFGIADTPGVYGISSFNDEEKASRDIILHGDIILNIVDASHLERDLFLTRQLIDMGKPLVVALNFWDEAAAAGLEIDADLLAHLLGVAVVPTVAVEQKGLARLAEVLPLARVGRRMPELSRGLADLRHRMGCGGAEAMLVLEGDPYVAARLGVEPGDGREEMYVARRRLVDDLVGRVVTEKTRAGKIRDRLGRAVVNPVSGLPLLAVVLFLVYHVIGVRVAGDLVGLTEETVMRGGYEPWIRNLVGGFLVPRSVPGQLLIGEFGLLTMTVTYLLGLLLPLVLGFYGVLSLMEDSGYLPRLATLVDRLLTGVGLNGRAVIPLILGLGCVQLGTITTRLLNTEREKSIATVLLNLAVPCSAQIGVIVGMLAAAGGSMTMLYGGVIFSVLAVAGTILHRLLPGSSAPLLIELPPMRPPRPVNVLRKTAGRSWFFLKEATPWFFLGSFIVAILQISGGLELWQQLLAPVTEGWLQLPREAAVAFVMGMVRRDFGAAGLTGLAMNPLQMVTSLIVITLFVPCIASLMILFKERGLGEGLLVWGGSWAAAFLVGGIFSQVMI